MDFFQKGLTPPPDFWNFWDTFSRLLELLGHFLEKCPKSPLKKSFTQKVSQNFWIASEPPPLLEEVHNKAAFFLWEAP